MPGQAGRRSHGCPPRRRPHRPATGEFRAAEYGGPGGVQALVDELSVLRPREVLLPRASQVAAVLPELRRWASWSPRRTRPRSTRALPNSPSSTSFAFTSLDGFRPAGSYRRRPRRGRIATAPSRHAEGGPVRTLVAGVSHQRRVPIHRRHHLPPPRTHQGARVIRGSLLHEIDRTRAPWRPAAARLMLRPLVELERIRERLDA